MEYDPGRDAPGIHAQPVTPLELYVLIVFLIVYLGMAAGRVPQIGLDRTGMALAGVESS